MANRKFDYSKSTVDIFYEKIYPLYAKEFLFGNNYEKFALLVAETFILNSDQWENILDHWDVKESLLTK
jgi:hypothetical protein